MDYVRWIRSQVGHRKIFLAYGSVVLRDDLGRVLFIHRRDNDLWGLPGGVMELDEDLPSAARRELFEETGLEAGPLRLIGVQDDPVYDVVYPNGDAVHQFVACFSAEVAGGTLKPDLGETHGAEWLTPDEIASRPMAWYYRERVAWALDGDTPHFRMPNSAEPLVDPVGMLRPIIGTALCTLPGASVLVTRDDGKLLMLRRVHQDHWHFPAGYAMLGENMAATAVREVREETNLDIEIERIVSVYSSNDFRSTFANGDQVKNVGVLFRACLLGGEPRLDEDEIGDMCWVDSAEAPAMLNAPLRSFGERAIAHLDDGYFVC